MGLHKVAAIHLYFLISSFYIQERVPCVLSCFNAPSIECFSNPLFESKKILPRKASFRDVTDKMSKVYKRRNPCIFHGELTFVVISKSLKQDHGSDRGENCKLHHDTKF